MKGGPLLPSTPLDWMRGTARLRGFAVWKPPQKLSQRARYVFLILALGNALGIVGMAFGEKGSGLIERELAIGGAAALIASWMIAYRTGRHRGWNALVEGLAIGAACYGVGPPHQALGVVYAGTFYTALFDDLRVARMSGILNTVAFFAAVGLTRHPVAPPFLSAATFAPGIQVLVMGALIFSMGRMIERTEKDRERAGMLAKLGEALVGARDVDTIGEAGVEAAMGLAGPEGGTGAVLFLAGSEWKVLAARGVGAVGKEVAIPPVELPAALTIGALPAATEARGVADSLADVDPDDGDASGSGTLAVALRPVSELRGADAVALAARMGAAPGVRHAIAVRGEAPAGAPRPVLVALSPVLLSEETRAQLGVVVHQVALALDLERSQKALVASERMAAIGKLAATVGHELRNPLAAIRSAAQYLKRKTVPGSTEPRIPEFFDIIDREVQASNRIITELLDFARTRPLQRVSTDLRALVEEVRQIVPLHGAELVNAVPEGFPAQLLDRDQIRQVVMNLVQNAADALNGEQAARIDVRAEIEQGAGIVLRVEDNGPGMPEDVAARAFEPLFTTKSKGTGLGLALVAKVAEAHRGSARIERRRPRGTRVVIELPPAA